MNFLIFPNSCAGNLLPLQKLKFKFSLNMLIEGQLILPLTETETSIQYNVVVKLVT